METLVLDISYLPVARVSWQRALALLSLGKIEVVEEYADRTIRAVTFEIKMPSIVRFLKAARARKKVVKFSRENVYLRDRGRCQYCNQHVPREEITYDHVVPRSQQGTTTWTNVVIACMPCNQAKGCRTPAQAKMQLLTVPVQPKRLPEQRFTITWRKDMPETWRGWVQDHALRTCDAPKVSAPHEHKRAIFQSLAQKWRSETRWLSSSTEITLHPAYQAIIGMGVEALPLILEDLRQNAGHWHSALTSISNEDPVAPQDRGSIKMMKIAWLQWGASKGLIRA